MMNLLFKTFLFKKSSKCIALGVLTLIVFLCVPFKTHAENTSKQQNQLQKKISKAKSTLTNSRSVSNKLEKTVQAAEDKLHSISKKLHVTEQKINRLTTNLNKSNKERGKLLVQTNQQKDALAQQMQALYTSGKQSHLRLLLKQDDPSDISRTVKYFEYMNKHRLKRIGLIKTRLNKIKTLQTQINEDSEVLKTLQEKQHGRKSSLKKAVKDKEKAYKNQKKVVYSQQQKLSKLRKQESRLQDVIKRLAQKRKREEANRKQLSAKKKAQEDKERKERDRQLAKKAATKLAKKQAIQKQAIRKKVATTQRHYVPDKPFSKLRGKLAWPVRGKMTQKFGSSRNSKQRWKGVIISAAAGTRVHAIARGKIEFSGRLRGYGYLVIIRHDKNYRSLYAYNRSVYKKEGQIVKAGEIIAAVGSSGSQSNSGLYFEIRKGTAPQNPNRWIR